MRVRLLPVCITGVAVVCCGCSATHGGASPKPRQNAAAVASHSPSPGSTAPFAAHAATGAAPAKASSGNTSSGKTSSGGPSSARASAAARRAAAKKSRAAPVLQLGDHGQAVATLQKRLRRLGYWLGPANGTFGDTTQQAVYAVQKAAGITPDGVAGRKTAAALARGARPRARTRHGHVIEVDLRSDLLMIVNNGKIADVLNTSTGGGYPYATTGGGTAIAQTPTGTFQIERTVDGMDVSPLGQLWRPRYFYGGYAIHGDSYVPGYPVSHGCVRVSDAAIDWIWASDQAPIGTEVFVYS